MEEARERIIFPLDLPSKEEAIDFVRLLKRYVGCFKVGLELFISEGPEILRIIAQETDTPIFLDLKLHDIPQTMKRAYRVACRYGPKFITVHCYEGNGLFEELTQDPLHPKILSVTLLTSMNEDNLRELGYRDEYISNLSSLVLKKAHIAKDAGCDGVICSGREVGLLRKEMGDDFILVTPGIRMKGAEVKEDDQKRIFTPYDAIKSGADYIVVGRPIRDARSPVDAAIRIQEEIQRALEERKL